MAKSIIKYSKQLLIPSFINRVNQMAKGDENLMALGSKHISWFNSNIDYIAREIELIMSIISSASAIYTVDNIIYTIGYSKSNDTDFLANSIEKFFVEKMAEKFYIQNVTNIKNTPDNAIDIYAQIKSLTLKMSSDKNGNYKR